MQHRWNVLALLFVVRLSMAFQFQSVAAMSPSIMQNYGVGLSDMGLLISLYLAPGLAFALPGGAIGRWFGDKRVVLLGLGLMVAGGVMTAFAPSWGWQMAARIVAGSGGVLLNVLLTKMVTDWFAGHEIATAMAIIVNAWPAGIALCLVTIPAIVAQGGMTVAIGITTAFCALGFVLLAVFYRPPAQTMASGVPAGSTWPPSSVTRAVIVAGCIWGLFNAAISVVFGFGPALLVERGWSNAEAGFATSLVLWLTAVAVPAWGYIADRTGRRIEIMLTGFALFAVALVVAARTAMVIPAFVALGLVAGAAAGPIMSLPARILAPQARAVGMGLYSTLFYVFIVAAPIVAGWLAVHLGTARVTFDLGAVILATCFPAYWLFRRVAPAAGQTSG
jgi:MFS family permease